MDQATLVSRRFMRGECSICRTSPGIDNAPLLHHSRPWFPIIWNECQFLLSDTRRNLVIMTVGRNIIVVGGSAGGLQALLPIVGALPAAFPAAILGAFHTAADSAGTLPGIVGRSTELKVTFAEDEGPMHSGQLYLAPPDRHLLVKRGWLRVVRGPKEHGFRPAIDPLFRSAAAAYGPQVIGVLLSGGMNDGAAGMAAIKREGGTTIAQDPDEAVVANMPRSAIRRNVVDHILRAGEIGKLLLRLVAEPVAQTMSERHIPVDPTESQVDAVKSGRLAGPPSIFTCPECGGSLWELSESGTPVFRCHVGHGFSPESLIATQDARLEEALWSAVRALEERAELSSRMAERARNGNMQTLHEHYLKRSQEAEGRARFLRELLFGESASWVGGEIEPETPGPAVA